MSPRHQAAARARTALLRVLVGCAGAGKSTWCAQHDGQLGTVLSLDRARAQIGRHEHDHDASPAAVRAVRRQMADILLAGGEVTLDATSTEFDHRRTWLLLAARYHARAEAVVFRPPLRLCINRNAARARPVPAHVVRRMWEQVASLDNATLRHEGFARVTEADTWSR